MRLRRPADLEEKLYPLLADVNQQTQSLPSLLLIAFFTVRGAKNDVKNDVMDDAKNDVMDDAKNDVKDNAMNDVKNDMNDTSLLQGFLRVATPWTMSTDGLVRTLAQSTCFEVMSRLRSCGQLDAVYESLFAYLSCNQHIISMRKRQMAVIAAFDPAVAGSLHAILASLQNNLNDFVPEALLDKLATEMSVLFDLWHQNGSSRAAASTAESVEGVVENFQKKILPWEDSGKDEVATRKKQDIVLVASLVNKMSR